MIKRRSAATNPTESAVRWYRQFVAEDVSKLSSEELTDWVAWSAEPEHLRKFRTVKRVWRICDAPSLETSYPTEAEIAADEYDGSVSMAEWGAMRAPRNGAPTQLKSRNRQFAQTFKYWALAACASGLVVALVWQREFLLDLVSARGQTYATTSTQKRTVTLSDGSAITLAPDTQLTTHYTASRRDILLNRGEAWFKVARSNSRPFTVFAGTGAIVALGTQFDVRREKGPAESDRVTVTVGYGAVEVRPPSKGLISAIVDGAKALNTDWVPTKLVRGQEISYNSTGLTSQIQETDVGAIASWKQVRLAYEDTPLSSVIPELNHYSDKPIVLSSSDGKVGELPYSGTVFELQIPGWLETLQATYPVVVTELPDRFVIRLRHGRVKP